MKRYWDKKIFSGHGCLKDKVSSYQNIIHVFYIAYLGWSIEIYCNNSLQLSNVAIYFYLFITILCAKISRVMWALGCVHKVLFSHEEMMTEVILGVNVIKRLKMELICL